MTLLMRRVFDPRTRFTSDLTFRRLLSMILSRLGIGGTRALFGLSRRLCRRFKLGLRLLFRLACMVVRWGVLILNWVCGVVVRIPARGVVYRL